MSVLHVMNKKSPLPLEHKEQIPMTIVIAIKYKDGLVVGADRRITQGDYILQSMTKIDILERDNNSIIFGDAGALRISNNILPKLKGKLNSSDMLKDIAEKYRECIREIYLENYPKEPTNYFQDKYPHLTENVPQINSLICGIENSRGIIYRVESPSPISVCSYEERGIYSVIGEEVVSNFILRRLFQNNETNLEIESIIKSIIYCIDEVCNFYTKLGDGFDIFIYTQDGINKVSDDKINKMQIEIQKEYENFLNYIRTSKD